MTDSSTHQDNFDAHTARSLLDQLITDSKLYYRSADYKALLDFVVRLRNFAPFNAMLLNIQKPGLSYAASARDWRERFDRRLKVGARPLLILWPFGPVALVYDVLDTDGKDLPEDVVMFIAQGAIDREQFDTYVSRMNNRGIFVRKIDAGDGSAGSISIHRRAVKEADSNTYNLCVNENHPIAVQFTTVAHELAHLFLGHLGPDKALGVGARRIPDHAQRELEAESVAYLVCERQGVTSKSHTYLARFVDPTNTIENIDLYRVMRAAGQVETLLDIAAHARC